MGLHRVDAEEQLVGDLLVRRRGGIRVVVLVRPAQGGDDLPLGRATSDAAVTSCSPTLVSWVVARLVSRKRKDVEPSTNVSPSRSRRRPLSRSPLRNVPFRDSPSSTSVQSRTDQVEPGVHPRHPLVPGQPDVAAGAAPDGERRLALQGEELLRPGVVPVHQDRPQPPGPLPSPASSPGPVIAHPRMASRYGATVAGVAQGAPSGWSPLG